MLNPASSHHKSSTLSETFDFGLSPTTHGQSQNQVPRIQSHADEGLKDVLGTPSTIPQSYNPPRPLRSHHRSFTEQLRSSRGLPPLLAPDVDPKLSPNYISGLHKLDTHEGLEPYSYSPEHSRQSSPARDSVLAAPSEAVTKPNKIASWFTGESAPIKVGLVPSPIKEKADPLGTPGSISAVRPTSMLHRKSASQISPKSAMASRFSFFNSKASLVKAVVPTIDPNDDLLNLDTNAALFPAGSPDPFSPAAFKHLQQQAEGVLARLQTAYRERTTALRHMAAEKEALAEETQGAEIRARHLKMQLDDMAAKVAAQDEAVMNLVDELAQEKLARRDEEDARKRSIRLVDATSVTANHSRMRRSDTFSDNGFESEDDSCSDSVFSRRDGTHSPTMSMSSVSTNGSPESHQSSEIVYSPSHAARLRLPPTPAGLKGLSPGRLEPSQQGCMNCHGVRASEASNVASVLKEENQCLKQRVEELEGALDGCLDVVGRLGG